MALPVEHRGKVEIEGKIPAHLDGAVEEGRKIVEAYVHPDLLPKVRVFGIPAARPGEPGQMRSNFCAGDVLLEPDSTARTAAHEITHGIEWEHPEILAACRAFLMKRAAGQPPKRLAELTKEPRYGNEMAYEDRWAKLGGSPYSGKISANSTEILTMGVTRLHNNPAEFARTDPEYFMFVVKILRKW
jgi:hypothetical protein